MVVGAGVYVPAVLTNRTWPDSVKKDFVGQLHKFMAFLTELSFQSKGKTMLYIPSEEIEDASVACKEKDLVRQLARLSSIGSGAWSTSSKCQSTMPRLVRFCTGLVDCQSCKRHSSSCTMNPGQRVQAVQR